MVKQSEALFLQNKVSAEKTMELIENMYGPYDEKEISYYEKKLQNDDGEIINGFQMGLIFNLWFKEFGNPISAYTICKTDYIKLLIATKKLLLTNNMVILPYIISSKVERLQIRKSINKKELTKIEASDFYKQIQAKYRNAKIEKHILSIIATILTSDFKIIDFYDNNIDGKNIVNIPDIISEEVMMYVTLV